jgi:hypothetical protein
MFSSVKQLTILTLAMLLAANLSWAQSKDGDQPDGGAVPPSAVFGPDDFGNVGYDSSTPQCTFDFIDITATGTLIASGDDVISSAVNLPAAFNLYGTTYNTLWANTNGAIGTAGNFGADFTNDCPLPATPTGSGARVYPLHDDLISDVRYQYFAPCPRPSGVIANEACHVFQWLNAEHFGIEGQGFAFQAVLYETSYAMAFQHGPGNPELGSGSTTGIQNAALTDALVYACESAASIAADSAQCIFHASTQPFGLADAAGFEVNKTFNDGNPGEVEVTITCNTGLPLQQSDTISEGDNVTFVVGDFETGTLDCEITETAGAEGYTVTYNDGTPNEESCTFEDVLLGVQFVCNISNELQEVEVVVTKEWIDDNPQFNAQNIAEATFSCVNEQFGQVFGTLRFFGNGDTDSFDVFPHWDGTTVCDVTESFLEGGVEADSSDCQDLSVTPGSGASCTIVNTRLFEGIPTLSQYGLALLAMLMLGIGFVAYRRIA